MEKKALLIGINYVGTNNALNGCINDQHSLRDFLVDNRYFSESEMTLLNDKEATVKPTKSNILSQFEEMVKFSEKHKDKKEVFLFISYSGHGSHIKDCDGDEEDGRDEVLCPSDCRTNGYISDDLIKSQLIDKLYENVKLLILMDCCHSGTIVDLRYNYLENVDNYTVFGKTKENQCRVVMISGCKDTQTSADAYIKRKFQGAMTASFLSAYDDKITYKNLINEMRKYLKRGNYSQVPQLSSSFVLEIEGNTILDSFN